MGGFIKVHFRRNAGTVPMDWFPNLRAWANRLNWPDLEMRHQYISYEDEEKLITWYESGNPSGRRDHCALQINEQPIGDKSGTFAAAVYAVRYALCSGWHTFTLTDDDSLIMREADRLRCWLDRSWFDSATSRREYRQMHPECAGYSWRRLRQEGPPHSPGESRDRESKRGGE
jgi:hypothetical protein